MNQAVIIENVSGLPQEAWVTIPLPTPILNDDGSPPSVVVVSGERRFPAVLTREGVLHVRAEAKGRERLIAFVVSEAQPPPSFSYHPWVTDDPSKLIPTFTVEQTGVRYFSEPTVFWDGNGEEPADYVTIQDAGPALVRWRFRTRIRLLPLMIEGWIDVTSRHPILPIIVRMSYGSTNIGEPREKQLGSVSMLTGERVFIDWGVRKGLHEPVLRSDLKKWETEIATPASWFRCRTVEVFGAMMCLANEQSATYMTNDMMARMQGPLVGMASKNSWANKFGVFALPEVYPDAQSEQVRRRNSMNYRLTAPANEYEARPYAQPPNSGQTGEQDDFGATRCEHAVAKQEPWAIYDLRYSAQAWMLRPYANREPNGRPVTKANHPRAATYNLRPDERFYSQYPDNLGWPNPVGWISGYTTSDSQHRSDNLLYGLYLLTRDPSIKRTIEDMVELDKMGLPAPPPQLGQGVGSPRGWGRPLMSWCQGYAAGFHDYEPIIKDTIQRMYLQASYRTTPNDLAHTVRVLSSNESKYGWNTPDGRAIRAWLPWQESIAIMGAYAAYKLFAIPEALEMCVVVASTIARHAFFRAPDTTWRYCYAVRWREDDIGAPLPATSYNMSAPNYDVFVTGDTQRWAIPALKILVALAPASEAAQRAKEILAYFSPRNWSDSVAGGP